MMQGTLGPAAFKVAIAFQMSAIATVSRREGGTLPGALLASMMLLSEGVKGQSLCPQLAGSYNTPYSATGVVVSGNYAYVADGSLGLQIIDVSIPCPTSSSSSSTTFSSSTTSTQTSSSITTSSSSRASSSSTIGSTGSTVSNGHSLLWVGLLGGGALCLCLIGGTALILRRRQKTPEQQVSLPIIASTFQSSSTPPDSSESQYQQVPDFDNKEDYYQRTPDQVTSGHYGKTPDQVEREC
ncbi:MAG: hypothetical protein K940chlam7_00965 [Chlamydiae bacterium]|nr:hypothetical protein [Chlamydiota bacterium]